MSDDNIDADKLAALEALLLKERERRFKEDFSERAAKGGYVVMGVPGEEDVPPGAAVIYTGVPRGGLDDDCEAPPIATKAPEDKTRDFGARRQVSEALHAVDRPMPSTPAPRPVESSPDEGPYRVHAQTRGPDPERGDPGEIAEGSYTISRGIVRVEDAEGRPLGSEVLRPGDLPAAVARKILRTTKSPEPFWNPINYTTH